MRGLAFQSSIRTGVAAATLAIGLQTVAASGGVVDLDAAGCPPWPGAAQRVGIHLVLHEDGTAADCRIGTTYRFNCGNAYDERDGFLCIGFNGNNPPAHVGAEGAYSNPVERFIVDGYLVPPEPGFANSHYTAPFGSGPSGATYDVIVEHRVGARLFVATMNVTATTPDTVEINGFQIRYSE